MFEIVRGNLLEADAEAYVNTVNTVGVMGRGIALQFKNAFPGNFKSYKKACDKNEVLPGHMFVYERLTLDPPRYIINFPTKRHWKNNSRVEDIESGLKDLVKVINDLGIKSIAVPPLGCGLGGLNWNQVRSMIEKAFSDLPDVKVFLYEPKGAPAPEKMKNVTKRPKMTKGRAIVIELMDRYCVPGYEYPLSLLEIQKLTYFLQEAGEDLKLNFAKEMYGPYADNLRHVLKKIEGHYIIGYGDGKNSPDVPIKLKPKAKEEAKKYLADKPVVLDHFERVVELIEGYETPYGMELLSSVHWVAAHENESAKTDVEIAIKEVHNWNERKARIKSEHIKIAWKTLREQGWLQ